MGSSTQTEGKTVIVRGVLVTALNLDIGAKIRWPSRLQHVPDRELV